MAAWRGRLARLGVVLVFALGAILSGCGSSGEEVVGAVEAPDTTTLSAEPASRAQQPSSNNVARAAAARIDESSIEESLAHLTGASPAPLASGPTVISERGNESGRRAAALYMRDSFEEMGIPARIIQFDSEYGPGYNVEAILDGSLKGTEDEKHLWVTAHLDSFYNAGANDDASGLVSVLMVAKALKELNPKHTVHFVAYDLEEVGLVGSALYVGSEVSGVRDRQGQAAIIGNIHSDMMGYDEGGDLKAVMGSCGARAGAIDEAVLYAAEAIDSPVEIGEDCLGRSDHQHFWDAGLPAVVLTDGTKYDGYPWYHEPGDTMDKLNLPYLRSVIQLTAASAALLAAPESES